MAEPKSEISGASALRTIRRVAPYLWPLGELIVKLTLTPLNERETQVTLAEEFAEGPMRWVRTKAGDLMMHVRNKEALRRLADLATRRGRA